MRVLSPSWFGKVEPIGPSEYQFRVTGKYIPGFTVCFIAARLLMNAWVEGPFYAPGIAE